ncbi:MAG: hypothetical protein R8G66_03935 [Cytophagales bacterium]|nr:hypothetical protein [Cytophagales bacterium]
MKRLLVVIPAKTIGGLLGALITITFLSCKEDDAAPGICRIQSIVNINDGVTRTEQFEYNEGIISSYFASAQLPDGREFQITGVPSYDDEGRLIRIRVSDDHYTEVNYSDNKMEVINNNPIRSLAPQTYLLNEQNQIIELEGAIRYEYNESGQLIRTFNLFGSEPFLQFEYEYDNSTNPLQGVLLTGLLVIDQDPFMTINPVFNFQAGPNNLVKSTRYDQLGQILSEVTFDWEYNELGLPVSFEGESRMSSYTYECR